MRLILLGSPGRPGDPIERWHDDAYEGALQLGWDVQFLRARDNTSDEVVRAAKGSDMLLWMRTHDYNIRGEDGEVMLRRVEDLGVRTAGIHFDLYWGIRNRQARIGREAWWTAQHVFTSDGGPHNWGAVNHHWCPSPFGTRYLGYGTPSTKYPYDAVFVGSIIRGIHSQQRSNLISWGRWKYGPRFRHIGRRMPDRMYGRDLNDLFASVQVVLGDSAPAPNYWSDRIVRTLGRGGLLAYPRTVGLDEQGFTDQVMIQFPGKNFPYIANRLAELSPKERRDMTDAAIALVESRHLWRHRLADIQRTVFA